MIADVGVAMLVHVDGFPVRFPLLMQLAGGLAHESPLLSRPKEVTLCDFSVGRSLSS